MAARPGQVRFEAWVPAALYDQLRATVPNRKAWLLQQMIATVGADAEPEPRTVIADEAAHQHRRERVGDKWVAGVNVGHWRCKDCDAEW